MTKFKFKKKYGQNFLQSETISNKIVDSIQPEKDDLIIEIGPGAGAITKKLKKYNCQLLAYEIDVDVKKYLTPLEDEKTKIIFEDFLEPDILGELKKYNYRNLYIIGNLPYYITTPIIERIIELELKPREIVIMVQKEVAERFLAHPKTKDYGYMTVILQYNFIMEKIIDVNRNDFYPSPNVDSTVIKLSTKEKDPLDYEKFKSLLKNSFQFKRKTINNNLKNYDLEKVRQILEKRDYSLSSRAEELDLSTFIELSKNL